MENKQKLSEQMAKEIEENELGEISGGKIIHIVSDFDPGNGVWRVCTNFNGKGKVIESFDSEEKAVEYAKSLGMSTDIAEMKISAERLQPEK